MMKNHLGYMTWPEVKEAAVRRVPVLIPVGTTETQGLHAPLGHDYIVAERLAWAVAEREDCLVTPTLAYGYSQFAKSFPGTISLRPDTVRALLQDIAESLLRYGFRHFIFINNHGLNEPVLRHVAEDLRERHGVIIASIFPSKLAQDFSRDLYETQQGIFAHGGEPTLSLMLYLAPEAMRMEGAERQPLASFWQGLPIAGPGAVRLGDSVVNVYMAFSDIAPTGASGDPAQASPEKGRIMFERMVNLVAGFVAQFRRVAM